MGFYGNKIIKEEVLNEKTIFKSPKITLAVNPDQSRSISFAADPYFKVYDAESVDSAKRVARISVINPHYVYHSNNKGKSQWILNSAERKILMNTLITMVGTKTVYELLLDAICGYCGVKINIPLPDFSIIKK